MSLILDNRKMIEKCGKMVHLIAHGSPGKLLLGQVIFGEDNFSDYKKEMAMLGNFARDGIFIYSCSIAQGMSGNSFLEKFSK